MRAASITFGCASLTHNHGGCDRQPGFAGGRWHVAVQPPQPAAGETQRGGTIKAGSNYLRGAIVESLADPLTASVPESETQLLKFHGTYQQDDRDLRNERAAQKLEPAYELHAPRAGDGRDRHAAAMARARSAGPASAATARCG